MQLVAHLTSLKDLEIAKSAGVNEVLLGHRDLSVQGTLDTRSLHELADAAQKTGIRPVLVWDTLMRDEEIEKAIQVIQSLDMNKFAAIRVLDPGALEFSLNELTLPIQLILKTGNHNFVAIQGWVEYCGTRLEKVVLSSELPKAKLQEYIQKLSVKVEVLGLGPILLFYTPRYLLTYQTDQDHRSVDMMGATGEAGSSSTLSAMASCEENTHKGFRLIETKHGTLMFHAKDYCLVDRIPDLRAMGLGAFQIDLRQEKDASALIAVGKCFNAGVQNQTSLIEEFATLYSNFIAQYPRKVTQCFYGANLTDVLFKKLKNTVTQRKDDEFIGEVIETQKKHHMVIQVMGKGQKLTTGIKLRFITPMGKMVETTVNEIRDLNGKTVPEVLQGDYAVLASLSSVSPTTVVYQTRD